MAVANVPRKCGGSLTKLLLSNQNILRRSLCPCIRWPKSRMYSIAFTSTNELQVATSFFCQHRIPFTSSTLTCRSNISNPGRIPDVLEADPEKLVLHDLQSLFTDIRNNLETEYGMLHLISNYYFDGKGKAIRPMIVLLMARALNSHLLGREMLLPSQKKIAITIEMIHTATLVHDDVLDNANLRRGKPSVNAVWDHKPTILSGDFIIAVVAVLLGRLKNMEATKCISVAISDLVAGELLQSKANEDENERFANYLKKTYMKTASLIANSCKAAAVLCGCNEKLQEIAFQYGRNVGIAFQLIDDLLDFVSTSEELGKPATADLKQGIATAPVLFACQKFPDINDMIMRQFSKPGDIEKTIDAIVKSDGLGQTRFLAEQHCSEAVKVIQQLSPSPEQKALITITDKVLNRIK